MKVFVEMDYLQNQGVDYLSASYRDFVPEKSAVKRLIARHLKVPPSLKTQRLIEVERGIQRKEKQVLRPVREYIEKQIAAGAAMTPSYFARGILKIRKQNWFAYWKLIEEGLQIEEEEPEEEVEEYDDTALTEIHEWLTRELQHAFSGWGIEQDFEVNIAEDFEVNIAEDFTAAYKTRTFEFGLIRTARVSPDEVPYEETYYYIVYNSGKVKAYEMWSSRINRITGRRSGVDFDYMGFNREMRRIGAWK